MYIYNNPEINFNDFKKIYEKIHGVFLEISSEKLSIDELVEIYSNDEVFLNELEIINTSMNEVISILNSKEELKSELYLFLSVNRMICYILDDVRLFLLYISFIDDLLINFFNLIHMKLIKDNEYDEYFNKFFRYLNTQKEFFYTKIFEFNDEYENVIDEVTNILW